MIPTGNYQNLINKLDEFIKKYYLNKIIRGAACLVALFLLGYLAIILAEYYGYFGVITKNIVFYGFATTILLAAYFWLAKPILKYIKISKTINYEQASVIIGQHFPDIKDRLLNTLQLNNQLHNKEDNSLLEASIHQKITTLSPFKFADAVTLSENKKYAKYVFPPLVVLLIIALVAPSIIKEGTYRIVNHNQAFEKPAPFTFSVENSQLSIAQGDDIALKIKIEGKTVPQDVYVEDGTNSFKADKINASKFTHQFRNLQNSKTFRLFALGYYSKPFHIVVNKKPAISSFAIEVKFPLYTQKRNQTLQNPGDIQVPAGTVLTWKIKTDNSNILNFIWGKRGKIALKSNNNQFSYTQRIVSNTTYSLLPQSPTVSNADALSYTITCIADQYPTITVTEIPDSLNNKVIYFKGNVGDDYGFTQLTFNTKISKSTTKGNIGLVKKIRLPVAKNAVQDNFFYAWELSKTGAQPGDEIEYYFSITDNDAVNGPKTTKSPTMVFKFMDKDAAIAQIENTTQALNKKMQTAGKQAKQIQQAAQKLSEELLSKTSMDADDKKQAEELIEKQKQLENLLRDIEKTAQKNLIEQKNTNPDNRALLEKQKQIQNLFENVLDDKTKKLLENLQKLIDQNNKNQLKDGLQQMKADNKALEKEFDRMLELYKQLAFDQKLDNTKQKLQELAKKQEELSKQNTPNEQLKNQQDINKQFDEVKKDLKDLEQKSKETENNDFKNPEKEQKEIEKEMAGAEESLKQKQAKSAAKQQKEAAQKMTQLAQKLSEMQSEMESQESNINAQALRLLLKNLLKASFDQENLLMATRKTDVNDAQFVQLGKRQKNIASNLKTIQDSLYSLSKRVPQISATVNKETQSINYQINKTLENITERLQAETLQSQQYTLTAINNLALMLSDALQQLQNAMQTAKSGKGKPKPGMQQLSKMQDALNKNMQKAKQQMEQQGGLKPGQKPGEGQGGQSSKEFSQMAQQQQMIREAMEELSKSGNKAGGLQKMVEEMKQTETDLVYKRISQEVMLRQQQIQTKLLEAAKAEREKEQDTQKQSTAAKEYAPNFNLQWQQFQQQKNNDIEYYKTISPALNYFYKSKVATYYKNLKP